MTPVLIDGNNLVKRCIMATAKDDAAACTFTGGVSGTLFSLASFLEIPEVQAGPVTCFFDGGTPAFRLALLPDYKSKRHATANHGLNLSPETVELCMAQFSDATKMLESLGVTCLRYNGFEADDVIAAAVNLLVSRGEVPVVVSSDKDLWQTVNMGAVIYDLANHRWITDENFVELAGVRPDTYLLFRTLVGDASDSIVGCHGCGKKTAPKLIAAVEDALGEGLGKYEPLSQLSLVWEYIHSLTDRYAYQDDFMENYQRLKDVMRAIDLSHSFDLTEGLSDHLNSNPVVKKVDFLRLCTRLKLGSVLGSPDRFLRPFQQASARRSGDTVSRFTRSV